MEIKKRKFVLHQTADELNAAIITDLGEWRPNQESALEKVLFPEFQIGATSLASLGEDAD